MPELTKAFLTPLTDDDGRNLSQQDQESRRVEVHFNPESLQMSLTNRVQQGRGCQAAQHVTDATAQMTVDLVFDTTLVGTDVREDTQRIGRMMDPVLNRGARRARDRSRKIPAVVVFEWGTVKFTGYISSYRETLDFFSPEGIPLRSSVNLTIHQQERVFEEGEVSQEAQDALRERTQATLMNLGPQESLTQGAARAGDPRAARDLARSNNVDSLRHPGVETIAVTAGLRLQRGVLASIQVESGAGFGVGGRARAAVEAGFRTDVGAGTSLKDRIRFEEE